MKRIRDFRVTVGSEVGEIHHVVTGWHKAWDLAIASMEESGTECRIYDARARRSAIITLFTSRDLQSELSANRIKTHHIRWRSESIRTGKGQVCYAFSNVTDFGWNWVEGAKHELPFRMSFVERDVERRPRGMIARIIELGVEARNLIRRS